MKKHYQRDAEPNLRRFQTGSIRETTAEYQKTLKSVKMFHTSNLFAILGA